MFQAIGTMFDCLLQVGFDGPNRDAEPLGDFSVGQVLDPRQGQHYAPPLGQLRDGTPEQIELGTLLHLVFGTRTVIRNLKQAIDFIRSQPTTFGPPPVPGDIERDLQQIGRGIPYRPDLVDALDPQISFLEHVRGQIG
jgi:hypothetical protein